MAKMKKLILSLTVAACTALTVQAQDDKPKRPEAGAARPEGRQANRQFNPEERLKRLTEALTLNQEQQDKIKKIFEDSRAQFEGLRDLPQEERREKTREAMKTQNEKIAEVLTAEQKEKYKEMMARRAEGGPRRGGAEAEKPKTEGGAKPESAAKPEGAAKPAEKK
jgi:Spy/CpxP family protein refolding chaperone